MNDLRDKQYYLDFFGFMSIGIFSLGYILFIRPFAEFHIQFSFLDFPVFIGEVLLFICLCLFLLGKKLHFKKLNKRNILIICYVTFVIIKALYGYFKWGPLAFRHSALLYYPLFIIMSYSFFRWEFFSNKRNILISLVIILMFLSKRFDLYWTLSCFILAFILIWSIPSKKVKYVLLLALLLTVPYPAFFRTSRMMMLANFVSSIWLIAGLYCVLRIKNKTKIIIFLIGITVVVASAMKYLDKNAVKSIVSFKKMAKVFQYYDQEVVERSSRINYSRILLAKADVKRLKGKWLEGSSQSGALIWRGQTIEFQEARIYNPGGSKIKQIVKLLDEIKPEIFKGQQEEIQPSVPDVAGIPKEHQVIKLYNPNLSQVLKAQKQEEILKDKEQSAKKKFSSRDYPGAINNAVFRIFIWRDMLTELINEKPVFGFDFGKPLRSKSLEILNWGTVEWSRDGWIGAHNSYLHMIYRTGIVGVVLICSLSGMLLKMMKDFIVLKSTTGILLCGVIIVWFVSANFLLIFEMPYTAIPVWSIFGITLYYRDTLLKSA